MSSRLMSTAGDDSQISFDLAPGRFFTPARGRGKAETPVSGGGAARDTMIRSHVNTASNTNTNNMEGEDSWGQMSPQGFHFPPRSGGTSSSPSLPHGFGPAHESKTLQTTPASPGPAFNGLLGTGGPGEHTSTMSPAAQSGACAHARANSTTSAGRLLTVRELEHKHQEMMMAFNELQDFYGDCGNGILAQLTVVLNQINERIVQELTGMATRAHALQEHGAERARQDIEETKDKQGQLRQGQKMLQELYLKANAISAMDEDHDDE